MRMVQLHENLRLAMKLLPGFGGAGALSVAAAAARAAAAVVRTISGIAVGFQRLHSDFKCAAEST